MAATTTASGDRIDRVELHEFKYDVANIGLDASGNRSVARGATTDC